MADAATSIRCRNRDIVEARGVCQALGGLALLLHAESQQIALLMYRVAIFISLGTFQVDGPIADRACRKPLLVEDHLRDGVGRLPTEISRTVRHCGLPQHRRHGFAEYDGVVKGITAHPKHNRRTNVPMRQQTPRPCLHEADVACVLPQASMCRTDFRSQRDCSLLNLFVIAKALEPGDVRFAPEPGHLALGVVAMGLLGGLQSLLAGDLAA